MVNNLEHSADLYRIKKYLKKDDQLIIKEKEQKREVEIIDPTDGSNITIRETVTERKSNG